jgi:site-specific DNA recombinase
MRRPPDPRVVGYLRVSTDEQAREGISLAAQRARIEAYCASRDLQLVGVETDEGLSASTLAREGLTRALATLAAGDVGGLVVVKLDRLTRSVRDLVGLQENSGMGITWTLHSVSESVDTSSASGRMFLGLVVLFAQWERETTSERTKATLAHARANGQPLGAVPYGWRRVKVARDARGRRTGGPGRLEVDAVEQATLRAAAVWRAEGKSLAAIAGLLNTQGVRGREGGRWSASSVKRALERQAAGLEIPRAS